MNTADHLGMPCDDGCGSILFDLTSEEHARLAREGRLIVTPGCAAGRAVVRGARGLRVIAGLLSDTGPALAMPSGPVSLSRPSVVYADVTSSAPASVGEGDAAEPAAGPATRALGCSPCAGDSTAAALSSGPHADDFGRGGNPELGIPQRHLCVVPAPDRQECEAQTRAYLEAPHTFK